MLLNLIDHENHARFFATAAELLCHVGNDLAPESLAKMIEMTRVRVVSASESEAFERAVAVIGREQLPPSAKIDTRAILDTLATM